MKKAIFMVVVSLALVFTACKDKKVTTQYTIGNLGYQSGSVQGSQWTELQDYFGKTVEYNKIVEFEGKSLAENDAQAREFCQKEIEKIDTAYVCSLLVSSDFFIYGIATLNASGEYRIVKALKFSEDGTEEVSD
ncbi:MAG: hypothetical protein K5901_04600 [Bacteroidales bacterium]|nr:hypothetical protein [Bacteroidales bacterium]